MADDERRQGALAGLLTAAIARAADVPEPAVRRAAMLSGDLRVTAVAALSGGEAALARFALEVGTAMTVVLPEPTWPEADAAAGALASGD